LLAWTTVRCSRVMAGAKRQSACGWQSAGSDGAARSVRAIVEVTGAARLYRAASGGLPG